MASNNHSSKITEIAQKLYTESGSYYGAAKRLGNPSLRASLHRLLNEESFKPSEEFIKSLWQWANIEPVVIQVHPGSTIFGKGKGLLGMGQVVAILVMPPEEWQRHSMECSVCGEACPRWSSTQKYCERHSWQTPEGRRFQRKAKSAAI